MVVADREGITALSVFRDLAWLTPEQRLTEFVGVFGVLANLLGLFGLAARSLGRRLLRHLPAGSSARLPYPRELQLEAKFVPYLAGGLSKGHEAEKR